VADAIRAQSKTTELPASTALRLPGKPLMRGPLILRQIETGQ